MYRENNDYNSENGDQFFTMSPIKAAVVAVILVFILYQVGGALLTFAIFGLDFENADVNALRLLTVAGQMLFILAPALILAKSVYTNLNDVFRVKIPELREIGLFVLAMALLVPLLQSYMYIQNYLFSLLAESSAEIQALKSLLDEIDKYMDNAYLSILRTEGVFDAIFVVFVISVVPALCEEIFFRGFVQRSFEYRISPAKAAFITAVIFGLYHFNPYGLPALIALGFFFGYAAYKTGSLLIPIILHFLNNFFAVIMFFIFGEEEFIESDITSAADFNEQFFSFVLLLFLFLVLMYFINKHYYKISGGKNDLP